MKYCTNKTVDKKLMQLVSRGWTVSRTGGGHIKATSPTGAFCFLASSPSDHRAEKNILSAIRKIENNKPL